MTEQNDQQQPQTEEKRELVWANCTRKGCAGTQAYKLPTRQIAAAATAVRFQCATCNHIWSTPLGAPIVTDI